MENLHQHIEALVFSSETAVTKADLIGAINKSFPGTVLDEQIVESVLSDLQQKFKSDIYAFELRVIGGGYQFFTMDLRWKQLLYRSEVIANAMFNAMGPFAIRDLEKATRAGRFKVADARLTFNMAAHAIVGISLAITQGTFADGVKDEAVVRLLCMTGIGEAEAKALADRPRPPLPPENSIANRRLK